MVEILDSTLREGEQTPGVNFTIGEKLEIARLLDEFGVEYIEAGHPAVSDDVRSGLKAIAREGLRARIIAHSRAMRKDIDLALDCDVEWIGLFISVLEDRLKLHFQKDLEQICGIVSDAVSYAKEHGLKVRYTPEDTIRSDFSSVVRVSRAALEAGADRISVADTVGAATPVVMGHFVKSLIEETGASVNVHCHNDLGLAIANSLAAYDNGAVAIDTCVNGLGERAGITDLSTLAVALKVHYGISNRYNLELLPSLSRRVEELSGFNVARNAPIIGANAFSHNAGLHVSAALKKPSFYEVIPAEDVGRSRTFQVDKMSGRDLIGSILESGGIQPDAETMDMVLNMVKSREKGDFTREEIIRIVGTRF
ncbi:MAG: homocitrate synthase [Thermoplasmatota archaeon]